MSLKIRSVGETHPGVIRTANEDAFGADDALGFYAVADGVGGHGDAAAAARMAVDVTRDYLRQHGAELERLRAAPASVRRLEGAFLIERAVQEACKAIHHAGAHEANRRGLRTTLTCLVKLGASCVVGHAGDSRLYLVRGGQIHRLTADHTLTAWQVRAGLITPEQAAESPYRETLTRALGSHESVQVDTLFVELGDGDVLLLCTDGLYKHVTDDELRAVDSRAVALLPAELVARANARGASDNVTVLALACRGTEGAADDDSAEARVAALSKLPLFQHLEYREHVSVLAVASRRQVPAGTVLAEEGARASDLFVILSGSVAVKRGGRVLVELGPGAHFGEMSLVDDAPRSATVVALDPMDLLVIGRPEMMGLMRAEPVLAVKMLWSLVQSLSTRLRTTSAEVDLLLDAGPDTVHAPFEHVANLRATLASDKP